MATLGAALLAGMIGYLVWLGLTQEEGPPILRVTAEPPQQVAEGWLVPFIARNDGESGAAAVRVTGRLENGPEVEESGAELDYVPQRSEREGGLMFSSDPAEGRLALRIEGFSNP